VYFRIDGKSSELYVDGTIANTTFVK
jgi:hypothetical protein